MYTSKLDLTAENVECVQVVASFLQMEEIVMSCKVFRPSSTKDEQIKQPVNSQVKEVQRSSPVPQTTPAAPLPTTNKKIETTKPAVEMTPMFVAQPPPGLLVKQDSWDHPEGEMEIELGDSEDDNTEEEEVGEGEGEDEDEDEDVNDDDDDDDDDEEEDADDADDTFIDDENDDDYVPGHNLNSLDGNGHRMRTRSAKQQRKGQSVRGDPSLKMERGIQEIDSETEMELDKGSIKRKLENDFEDSMSDDSVKLLPNEISYTQRKALHSPKMLPKRPAPSKASGNEPKRQKNFKTLQEKVQLLDLLRELNSYAAVARHYGINESTVRYIKKNEAAIRSAVSVSVCDSAKKVTTVRNKNIVRMESVLVLWITDCRKQNIPLDSNLIRERARKLYQQFATGDDVEGTEVPQPGPSTAPQPEDFQASKGWFDRFQKRFNIKSVFLHGEAASADKKASEKYPKPKQASWKKMLSRTYILKDESKAPGFMVQKDRVTLMMCGNAAGYMM
ncbi:armadillo-like helical domain-containing protein 4 isoform X2 [Erpetoichthys calabaricus]|nr:armadillo-like helical domain-containing protein 4 isoform X2 [Erpetoichthys calabaricus]